MKKYTLLSFGFALISILQVNYLKAQITITKPDMPTVNLAVNMKVDTTGNFAPQSASAVAQTWNYSALGNSQTAGYRFVQPSTTLYHSSFPSSNLADSTVGVSGYTFLSLTNSSFSDMGFGELLFDSVITITLHPFVVQIPLPATYGTIDGGIAIGDTAVSFRYALFDSARGKVQVTYADTIDAYGVMTTPFGTDTVIRQKHYDATVDSAFTKSILGSWSVYQTTTTIDYQYRWYAKGINYYFAVMQMNSTNTQDSLVQWFDGNNLGISPISHSVFTKVYPNPCQSGITFSCSSLKAGEIALFDVTGRKVSQQEITNGSLHVNTSAYSAGIYFYQVLDTTGNILDRGKFIVQ